MSRLTLASLAMFALIGGCAVTPAGPTVMALPGSGKTLDQFRADDAVCRQYAFQQIGGVPANQVATASALGSAALGTAVGAAAGAAFNGGQGAAVGAGAGLLAGSVMGAGAAQASGDEAQRQYDYAYVQCMYASGERVPISGNFVGAPNPPRNLPPPPAY